jgi:hypothetical protein
MGLKVKGIGQKIFIKVFRLPATVTTTAEVRQLSLIF